MTRILVVGDPHEKLDFIDKLTDYIKTENNNGGEKISHYITLGDYIEGRNAAGHYHQTESELAGEVDISDEKREIIEFDREIRFVLSELENIAEPPVDFSSMTEEQKIKLALINIETAIKNGQVENPEDATRVLNQYRENINYVVSDQFKDDTSKIDSIRRDSLDKTRETFGNIYDQFAQRHRIIKAEGVEVVELLGNHDIDIALQRLENIVDNDHIKIGNYNAYCTFGGGLGMVDGIPLLPHDLILPYLVDQEKRRERYGISRKAFADVVEYHFNKIKDAGQDIDKDQLVNALILKSPVTLRMKNSSIKPEDVKFLFMHEPIGSVATNSHKQHRASQLSDYTVEWDYLAREYNWTVIGGHTHHSVVTKKDGYLSIVAGDKMAYDIKIDDNGGIENIQPIRYKN